MDKTSLKIAMAAFFHDMGKFVDLKELDLPPGYIDDNAGIFLPSFEGRYSHWHALYTAGFIEKMQDWLPPELNAPGWGNGEAFIRLAAAHHAASTPMEAIISLADRISSGMDREEFDKEDRGSVHFKDYKKTRLLPIFEHLTLSDAPASLMSETCEYRYALVPLGSKTIFPEKQKKTGERDKEQAVTEYREIFKGFVKKLKTLAHRQENVNLWFEHFDSLLREYAGTIPAARVGKVIPDVSLYDHLKSSAAIATAVYLFHNDEDTLDISAIENRDEEKFLLISGSFNGIQSFIFSGHGESAKFRSKILRGRSFYVSLLSELSAVLLCRKMDLPHTSVLLNAGGRFTVLAPNTSKARDALIQVEQKINDWLVERTFGETSITLSTVTASCRDFESTKFAGLWEKLVKAGDEKKFQKLDLDQYGGAVAEYLDEFSSDLSPSLCPLCGKRPAKKEITIHDIHCCAICRDHVFLGENLVKHPYLTLLPYNIEVSEKTLKDSIFGEFQLFFSDVDPGDNAKSEQFIKCWDLSANRPDQKHRRVTARHLNGYVPVYSLSDQGEDAEPGVPKTLNDIAGSARLNKQGLEALGVFKADVDDLGLLMACGLRENLYTVSRLATLSRQLNDFFSLYLPALLAESERFNNVYTVFAGGDDLFLIGPWNRIPELAVTLEDAFKEYVCRNPEIHFSAGITLHKPHTPVDVLGRDSEQALEQSKHGGRNRVTLFDRTVTWNEFRELAAIEKELAQWVDDQWISAVFLYRINLFINMAEEERKLFAKFSQGIHIEKMACTQWRSRLAYAVERNSIIKSGSDEKQDRLKYIREKIAHWLTRYGGDLRIPLWTLQYKRR